MNATLSKSRPADTQPGAVAGQSRVEQTRFENDAMDDMETSCVSRPRTIQEGNNNGIFRGEPSPRKVRRDSGNFRQVLRTEKVTNREITEAIAGTLTGLPAKDLADATGGSIRAAQNVKEGLNAMSLTAFINAARAIPELKTLALQLLQCETLTDPDFVRGISLLMNSYARKQYQEAQECSA